MFYVTILTFCFMRIIL